MEPPVCTKLFHNLAKYVLLHFTGSPIIVKLYYFDKDIVLLFNLINGENSLIQHATNKYNESK